MMMDWHDDLERDLFSGIWATLKLAGEAFAFFAALAALAVLVGGLSVYAALIM